MITEAMVEAAAVVLNNAHDAMPWREVARAALEAAEAVALAADQREVSRIPSTDRKRMLVALVHRLRSRKPGETYPLDVVERGLLLDALSRMTAAEQMATLVVAAYRNPLP